jgi:hypothetical protein
LADSDRKRREEDKTQQEERKPEWAERYRQATERHATNSAQQPDAAAPADQSADSV